MSIVYLPFEKQNTTAWQGGKTTEIFILPESSSYQNRDFDLRISRASIDVESSTFTALPDFQRWLMLLEGSIELFHSNSFVRLLKPFEVYEFDGGLETKSIGLANDFNVMIRKNHASVIIEKIDLAKSEKVNFKAQNSLLIYCIHGNFTAGENELSDLDAIYCSNDSITIECKSETKLVLCRFSIL